MGPELMVRFREQAARFGAEIVTEKVSRVDLSAPPVRRLGRRSRRGRAHLPRPTPSSSPPAPRSLMLGLAGEERAARARRVDLRHLRRLLLPRPATSPSSAAATPPLEEAIFLTQFASTVTLIHRRDELRASKIMQERACANDKIEFAVEHASSTASWASTKVERDPGPRRRAPTRRATCAVTGLFVAIGHQPNTDLFKGQLDMEDNGYLVTGRRASPTNVEGVFACGDVQDHVYRQAITAAGSGLHGRHRRRALARGPGH